MSNPVWYREAKKYKGLREGRGAANNPQVVAFYKEAHQGYVKKDSVPWCAAFVGAMLERTGYRSTRSLAARSYMRWGKKLTKPKVGCIVVFKRGNSTWQGHVAFFVRETANHVYVVGGNQADKVSEARYPKSKLLGYRWPRTIGASRTIKAGGVSTMSASMAGASDAIQPAIDATSAMSDALEWAKWAFLALTILSVGFMIWCRLDDAKNARVE